MKRDFSKLFHLSALLLACTFNAHAQTQPQPADTTKLVEYAVIPAISFNSDLGLLFGGQGNRYDYSSGQRPYTTFINSTAVISTRGLFFFEIKYDKPKSFGGNVRTTFETSIGRFFDDNFFGIGNNEKLTSPPDDNPDLYNFRSFTADYTLDFRFLLRRYRGNNRLEFITRSNLVYETPFDNPAERQISVDAPIGIDGGVSHVLSAGFVLDRRND